MKIRMLKNARGSENGTTLKSFIGGKTYDIEDSLGRVFIEEMRVAVLAHVVNLPVIFEIPEKAVAIETPEKFLPGKPRDWVGLQITPMSGGDAVTVKRINRGGKVVLSDGRLIHYSLLKREWGIANVD